MPSNSTPVTFSFIYLRAGAPWGTATVGVAECASGTVEPGRDTGSCPLIPGVPTRGFGLGAIAGADVNIGGDGAVAEG
jgi:hypothetical protein